MQIAQYYQPATLDEAAKILRDNANIKILAGGTDLIIALRERHIKAEGLLDISRIGLSRIYIDDGTLHVGSMATFHQIESNSLVLKHCPMLAEAASQVGAPQIRARATIGGNVANAATAADSLPVLLAMDAQAVVVNAEGRRTVRVEDLLTGVNQTALAPGDILTEFVLPIYANAFMAFEKIGRRQALAISRINLGIRIHLENGVVAQSAIAVGAVGKTAYRVRALEDSLTGKALTGEAMEQACGMLDNIVAEKLGARKTAPYKRRIAAAVLKRAFERMQGGDE